MERIDVLEHDCLGAAESEAVGQFLLALMEILLMRMAFVAPDHIYR
jgi:hypothetical protein